MWGVCQNPRFGLTQTRIEKKTKSDPKAAEKEFGSSTSEFKTRQKLKPEKSIVKGRGEGAGPIWL